ncbi:Myosin light chain kinase family member 4 [Amphibalanus amphitrite]|uniref:Myosin light chain kinase family member 4 n=1 Tax=Amphibalanus amphitrite TaxID=1232801 RepID=A0A6A4WNB2_AMPAM|nr:Myosin light chain kinase family member 4 [Amphibalanus amphitrite]
MTKVRDELSVHGQLLLRGDRLVVPAALRERVLTNAHAGHQGVVRTKQRLRERFWWPRLDRQVRDLLKSCEVCSQHDGHVRRERPPLQPIPLPDGPWQRLMVDVIGPMRGPSSERYGIVLVDMYSRWPEVALCQDATADSICQFLETVFAREGVPLELLSDNGPAFRSGRLAEFLGRMGVKQTFSSPYSPQTNGMVERLNRTVKEAIQSARLAREPRSTFVRKFLGEYRVTVHPATGVSPFVLMRGREARTILDVTPSDVTPSGRAAEDRAVRQHHQSYQETYRARYDRTATAAPRWETGDWVRVRKPGTGRVEGQRSVQVSRRTGPVSYRLATDLTLPFPPRDVTVRRNVEVREKFTMGEEVGRGKFGIVYRCTDKATGRQLAAKFVATPRKDDKRDVEREVEIMNYLQHPGIIQIFDAFDGGKEMTLVMELVEGGELFDRVIEDDYILTEKACAIFMRQVCAGVNFMHQKNVLHLDMKPENILCLSKTGNRIKIIDFGLARRYDPAKKLQVLFGTPEFVAPEVVNFDAIGYPTDMWSVGVIAYVLVSGLSPFMGDTDCETMANVTIAKYDFDDEAFDDVSDECKDFITKILIKDMSKRLTSAQALTHPWLTMRPPQQPMKARSRQASLACPEPHLETAQVNLTQFVERWLEHPTSPYAFSETSGDLALPRAGSAASVGLCSPSRCETLTTPELSSDEESSGDEEPLYRTETRPKPAEHTRVSNIRREESLKRARGRLVQQASKEERYISIDEVKTLKQQGSLDEMVAKVASLPTSRRGSVTQAPPPSRLRAPDSPRPQTPSPLASQPAGTPQRTQRQPSPAHASVCDRVMSEAAAALSDGTLDRQRLSPAPVTAVPAPSPSPGRSRSGAVSPLLAPTGKDSSPAKPTSRSPQPDSGPTLPVPTRSRSQTPSVTVTGAASPTADIERSAAKDTAAATSAEPDKLSVGDGKKPRKSKSKETVKKKSSTKHRPKHELDASRSNSGETTPSQQPKNVRRPREHIVQIEVVGCAGPEQADRPSAPEPALRKLRQALRTLSSGSAQSAPSSPYPSREGSPGCELRPAGLLLRSWHRDRLRDGAGWSGRGPSLMDFVSARLEEAAGCQRREQERFERLLRQRRPLSPPPATRRPAKGPLDWRRLGWSITDW